jgi:hypothetical protein
VGFADQSRVRAGTLAYASSVLFLALFVSAGLSAPSPISPILGLACHLIVLPIIAAWNLAAMGLGSANLQLTNALFDALRQGIHVNASVWIAAAS